MHVHETSKLNSKPYMHAIGYKVWPYTVIQITTLIYTLPLPWFMFDVVQYSLNNSRGNFFVDLVDFLRPAKILSSKYLVWNVGV